MQKYPPRSQIQERECQIRQSSHVQNLIYCTGFDVAQIKAILKTRSKLLGKYSLSLFNPFLFFPVFSKIRCFHIEYAKDSWILYRSNIKMYWLICFEIHFHSSVFQCLYPEMLHFRPSEQLSYMSNQQLSLGVHIISLHLSLLISLI